jgi:RHS repeat-associated protein
MLHALAVLSLILMGSPELPAEPCLRTAQTVATHHFLLIVLPFSPEAGPVVLKFETCCNFGSYIDEPLMMVTGGAKYYYHANDMYSTAALTDAAGAVVERYRYDPYGKVTVLEPNGTMVRAVSAVGNPLTYTGRRLDGETGLMYYRARYYDVNMGRFIGRDPVNYNSGFNLYAYCRNLPNSQMDPSGEFTYAGYVPWGSVTAWYTAPPAFPDVKPDPTALTFNFSWVPPAGAPPCGCTEVGFVQIVRDTQLKYGAGAAPTIERPWTIDKGVSSDNQGQDNVPIEKLPFYSTAPTAIWRVGMPAAAGNMSDNPGAAGADWYWTRVKTYTYDFETCLVCKKGLGGAKSKFVGEVYGCFTWQHSWSYGWSGKPNAPAGAFAGVPAGTRIVPVLGPPSATFINILKAN